MIGAGISPPLGKPIGYLDIIGHSHVADGGATIPDFGSSHKIDSFLQPALFRSAAKGGAVCCQHDTADGAQGNGGWATVAREFHRQEAITWGGALPPTTLAANSLAGATTISLTAVPAGASPGNSYLVIGKGASTEVARINGVLGTTLTVSAGTGAQGSAQGLQFAHSTGDPVYISMDNVGYLPKSQLVVVGYGANDVPVLGPIAIGTLSPATAGASQGLGPLQHAYRFCLAVMRCCVIYRDTHTSCVYGANWTSTATTSPASYPIFYGFGTFASFNFHSTSTAGSTVTFSTEPNFPGGTVDIFLLAQNNGFGASWNVGVTGATTRTVTGAIDTRNQQAAQKNSLGVAPSSWQVGCVYRLTNLNPGVNTITLTAATINNTAYFLGWGIESPQPPLIFCELDPRPPSFALWGGAPYSTRTPVDNNGYSTQTASVAAGAGTAANSVTLGTAVTVGTTGTGATAVYPGDTITIGSGASQETRVIVAVDSTTKLHVDANFVNAHTGDPCVIGYQDADLAGGGAPSKYGGNPADTQGKTSVPGLWSKLQSVINEFDQWVVAINPDDVLQKNQRYFDGDLVHYNDAGHALLAAQVIKQLQSRAWSLDQLAQATVPMTKTWIPVYGDINLPNAGTTYNFLNGWSNYYSASGNSDATTYPRTGYYKDMRTRMVTVQVYAYLPGSSTAPMTSVIFQLPPGYRPSGKIQFAGASGVGPAAFEIDASGNVYCTSNPSSAFMGFTGSFLAEQ